MLPGLEVPLLEDDFVVGGLQLLGDPLHSIGVRVGLADEEIGCVIGGILMARSSPSDTESTGHRSLLWHLDSVRDGNVDPGLNLKPDMAATSR